MSRPRGVRTVQRWNRIGDYSEEAVPLVLRNASRPEPDQHRDDDGDNAQAPPKHLKLPYP
jgi:hypothetical protein